jgi:hypothetical protein
MPWQPPKKRIMRGLSSERMLGFGLKQVSGVGCQEGCRENEELSGLEKTLERKVPDRERRWQVAEESAEYSVNYKAHSPGWPIPSKTET